jgi:predicted kinase/transcriptional regulator with XRE-family HTH domain
VIALRKAMHVTIDELAKRLCVARRTVINWESSKHPTEPRAEFQRYLDELLQRADDKVRERFVAELAATSQEDAWEALGTILEDGANPAGAVSDAAGGRDFRSAISHAWSARRNADKRLSLVLIGGFAGSGKTEFARFLATLTGWLLLDKDLLLRSVAEAILRAHAGDPNDRESPLYLERVRPEEYELLFETIMRNLEHGISVIASAPFLREMSDRAWLSRVAALAEKHGASSHIVWITCDVASMYTYLVKRNATRDTWKLGHWDEYLATIDPGMRPGAPHVVIDNSGTTLLSLIDQALRFTRELQR